MSKQVPATMLHSQTTHATAPADATKGDYRSLNFPTLRSLDPTTVPLMYNQNCTPMRFTGWLDAEPTCPSVKHAKRNARDMDSDDEEEERDEMRQYKILHAAWREQSLQPRRVVLLGRHGRPHDQTCPDGFPGENTGRPFDNVRDAPQIQIDNAYVMPMPDYTAANIVRLAATTNSTPDQVVDHVVTTPTLVTYPLPTAGLNLVLWAQPLRRMGQPALHRWRGGGSNGSKNQQEPVRWW
jgi:hypothetical protein